MERFWPKHAGEDGIKQMPNKGIRYIYGDFQDLINLLKREPSTRQAYLPIWFPEDTGALHNGRVPCTIGYWFVKRHGALHVTYHIRACDFIRHFRDDIYLCACLVQYLLSELSYEGNSEWNTVSPGMITMNIGSLHIFSSEVRILKNG
jgi:thymidylate synthase